MAKITKRLVDGLKADGVSRRIWDGELRGFGVRVAPTGLASYFLKYRTAAGRQRWHRIARVGEITPDEARRIARDTLAAVAKGEDPAAARMTVRDLAAKFLAEHVEPKKKPATASNYALVLRKHLLPRLGDCKAEMVQTADIAELHRAVAKQGKDGRPCRHQANRTVAIVSSMYTFAARHHVVPPGFNPAKGIERYREQGRERFLDGAELARLGDAIREAETTGIPYHVDETKPKSKHAPRPEKRRVVIDPYTAAALRLLLFTGARLREILHLRWSEIDFDRGLLRLADSKTGKKPIILNAPALAILADLPRASDYVIAGNDPKKPRADIKRPWELVRDRAKLEGTRLHDLRHSFASFGAGAGLGLPVVGRLLGHAQAATTQRYAHLDADPLRRASERIAGDIATALGEGAPASASAVRNVTAFGATGDRRR